MDLSGDAADLDVAHYGFEDSLFEQAVEMGELRTSIYAVPHPLVVLGRGSKAEVELDIEACRRDGVPVYRRRGGGCAVVLDPGNVIVAVATRVEGIGDNLVHFARLNRWLVAGLEAAGVEGVDFDGTSDLVIDDRKVGGTCIYRARGGLLYSASLLVDPRLDLIERYLRHPPREPEYRRGRSHREFLTSLATESRGLSTEVLVDKLRGSLGELL